jgi:hypothetical protein
LNKMNKNKSKNLSNRELIKHNILKGKEYYTHSGNFKSKFEFFVFM